MHYLDVLQNKLNTEDEALLKKIYEPTEVLRPGNCACDYLCTTDDGEIRFYSIEDKENYADNKQRIYYASNDCGLSWKKHLVPDGAMGHAYKSEYSGKYFNFGSFKDEDKVGFYIYFSEGYDEKPYKFTRIGDYNRCYDRTIVHQPRIYAIALKNKKRYIAVGEGRIISDVSSSFVMYSDDDCKTWNIVVPEAVPPMGKTAA